LVFGYGSVGQMVLVLFSFVVFFLWAVQDNGHDFLGGEMGDVGVEGRGGMYAPFFVVTDVPLGIRWHC